MLLKEGSVIYQGEIQPAINYFSSIYQSIQEYVNPFDYFLEIIENCRVEELRENYYKIIKSKVVSDIEKYNSMYKSNSIIIYTIESERKIKAESEIITLINRNLMNFFRNKSVFYARFFQFFCNSIIMISFYMNLNNKENKTYLNDFMGFCFNCVNNFFSIGMYSTVYSIYLYKNLFKIEYPSRLYQISSFYISTILTLFIPSLIYSFFFSILVYFTIFEYNFLQFINFLFLNILDFMIGASYGALLGFGMDETRIFSVAPFIFIISMLGSGVLRNSNTFPLISKFINYISHFRYLLELHIENEGSINIKSHMSLDIGKINCMIMIVFLIIVLNILSYLMLKRYARKNNL